MHSVRERFFCFISKKYDMKQKRCLILMLPEELSDLPVKIVRGHDSEIMLFNPVDEDCQYQDASRHPFYTDTSSRRYAFVWCQEDYMKISLDEIVCIEAERSYSVIRLTGNRNMTVSYNLSLISKDLPASEFIRIHRSYIINIKYVDGLSGNCLVVAGRMLSIGREYRKILFERFIFLGVRRNKSR